MSPAQAESLTFTKDIKPLFREFDREAMESAFDLWSYADVSKHADAILERLRDGSMPCDGKWPSQRIDLIANWIAAGKPE